MTEIERARDAVDDAFERFIDAPDGPADAEFDEYMAAMRRYVSIVPSALMPGALT